MIARCALALFAIAFGAAAEFQVATFSADVTVPLGHALMGGGILPAEKVVDPLHARGVVLLGGDKPVVLLSIEWCEIRNDAYDQFREVVASAAGTSRDHVLISSVHVHDAPVVDFAAQKLLDAHNLPKALCDSEFAKAQFEKVASAVRDSLRSPRKITHYGTGQAEAIELACNRRAKAPDGTVHYNRTSATADEAMRAQEAGEHDPVVRALSFWDGDTPVAALYAFSIHPMSYYGKGGVSADFVGMARQQMENELPGVAQIYFSGCSGDTIAGKWNDGNPANRPVLAQKLHAAMEGAWKSTSKYPLESMTVRTAALQLEPKASKGFTEDDMNAILTDTSAKTFSRILAAMGLSWRNRVAAGQPIDVPAIDFGRATFLLMPAESFVGYQKMAQQLDADHFVITAGYGECAPGYIPTAFASSEGFNDAHDWCWVAPTVEGPMKNAMAEALGVAK